MQITNEAGISLPLAVWLLHDTYDYVSEENYISATSLMKPVRMTVLRRSPDFTKQPIDLQDLIATSLGHSIHSAIEWAWRHQHKKALSLLGYPEAIVESVKINPTDEELQAGTNMIPVFIEQRLMTEFQGWTIGGKFDMVTEGILNDFKSTSAFSWLYGTRDDEHRLQGSIYRWLDSRQPVRKIHEDFIRINYIFTDWQKSQAVINSSYPQKRVETKDIPLLSLQETESWISQRLNDIAHNLGAPEKAVIPCPESELWMTDPQFKYYADPAKTSGRSTKNFDSLAEANRFHMTERGGKGIVLTVPGKPKRCEYCEVFSVCSQKDRWFSP